MFWCSLPNRRSASGAASGKEQKKGNQLECPRPWELRPGRARARSRSECQETAAPEQPRPATSFSTSWWPFLGSPRPRRNAVLRPRRPHGRSRGTEAPATDTAAPGAMPFRPDHLLGLLAAQLGLDRALYSSRGGPGAPDDASANRRASRTCSSPTDNPRGIRDRDSSDILLFHRRSTRRPRRGRSSREDGRDEALADGRAHANRFARKRSTVSTPTDGPRTHPRVDELDAWSLCKRPDLVSASTGTRTF